MVLQTAACLAKACRLRFVATGSQTASIQVLSKKTHYPLRFSDAESRGRLSWIGWQPIADHLPCDFRI